MEAKVSVIIPAYNAERFLRRSVDSVVAQSFTDWDAFFWSWVPVP